jgi:hypothetical protein
MTYDEVVEVVRGHRGALEIGEGIRTSTGPIDTLDCMRCEEGIDLTGEHAATVDEVRGFVADHRDCQPRDCQPHEVDYDEDYERGYVDDDRSMFADPGGRSALRAETEDNPRDLPCPTCDEPNRLTPADARLSYQCDRCADRDEGLSW